MGAEVWFGPYDDKQAAAKDRSVLLQVIYTDVLGGTHHKVDSTERVSPFSTAIDSEDGRFYVFVRLDRKPEV